jgi:predicted transcriptional regulator
MKETLSQDKATPASPQLKNKGQIRISTLGRKDAEALTDQVKILKEQIATNDDQYPGIDQWFATKVLTGLRSGERKAYLAFENEKPIAAAILKLGSSAKICHLCINEDHRGADLGQLLFIQMTMDAANRAREIHFTLPESLWSTKSGFFKSFGFSRAEKSSREYRKDDTELFCSAPISSVYAAALSKIPNLLESVWLGRYSRDTDVLMSIKPTFAERIVAGSKSVEIRKRFSDKWAGHDVILYASQPRGALVGTATIGSVTKGRPADIWSQFETGIACSKAEFDCYVGAAHNITAIELKGITPYQEVVHLSELSQLLREKLRPPQSYFELSFEKNSAWMSASYIAALLQLRANMKLSLELAPQLESSRDGRVDS